jgi:hypothetical protein
MDFKPPAEMTGFTFDSLPVSPESVLWAGFGFGLVMYIVMALIYHHHWSYYGISLPQKTIAVLVFNGGSLALLATIALLASAVGTL